MSNACSGSARSHGSAPTEPWAERKTWVASSGLDRRGRGAISNGSRRSSCRPNPGLLGERDAVASSLDTRRIKGLVRNRLLRNSEEPDVGLLSPPERRMLVQGVVKDVLRQERAILSVGALAEVVNEVSDEVVGLGPIERLLKDPEVSEVMVNGTDDVYVERKGRVEKAEGLWFEGGAQVLHLIERIVSPLGL